MKKYKTTIIVLAAILGVTLLGGGSYFIIKHYKSNQTNLKTQPLAKNTRQSYTLYFPTKSNTSSTPIVKRLTLKHETADNIKQLNVIDVYKIIDPYTKSNRSNSITVPQLKIKLIYSDKAMLITVPKDNKEGNTKGFLSEKAQDIIKNKEVDFAGGLVLPNKDDYTFGNQHIDVLILNNIKNLKLTGQTSSIYNNGTSWILKTPSTTTNLKTVGQDLYMGRLDSSDNSFYYIIYSSKEKSEGLLIMVPTNLPSHKSETAADKIYNKLVDVYVPGITELSSNMKQIPANESPFDSYANDVVKKTKLIEGIKVKNTKSNKSTNTVYVLHLDNIKDITIGGQVNEFKYDKKVKKWINSTSKKPATDLGNNAWEIENGGSKQAWVYLLYTPASTSDGVFVVIPLETSWGAYITTSKEILQSQDSSMTAKMFKNLMAISTGYNKKERISQLPIQATSITNKGNMQLLEGYTYQTSNATKSAYIMHIDNIRDLVISGQTKAIEYSNKSNKWEDKDNHLPISNIGYYAWEVENGGSQMYWDYYLYTPTHASDGILVVIPGIDKPSESGWKTFKHNVEEIISGRTAFQTELKFLNLTQVKSIPTNAVTTPIVDINTIKKNGVYIDQQNKSKLIQAQEVKALSLSRYSANIVHIDNIKNIELGGQVAWVRYDNKTNSWVFDDGYKITKTTYLGNYVWKFDDGGSQVWWDYLIYSPKNQSDGILVSVPQEAVWTPYFKALQATITK